MRISKLTIAGFRGFNSERTVDFHDRLTVVSAPNSHGKTSITEALEFLLYGETSKVARASSKEEYRDSYRNKHYPADRPAYIEAVLLDPGGGGEVRVRVEIDADGEFRRMLNGARVESWPFAAGLIGAARPFVVQHALKDLLLVPPGERFQGFAKLLGLNDVDATQQAIVNLCTKPEANLSDRAKLALAEVQGIEARLAKFTELQPIAKDLKKGATAVPQAFKKAHARTEKILGKKVKAEEALPAMIAARDAAAAKVFSGGVALKAPSAPELARLTSLRERIASWVSADFIDAYARLAARDATARLRKEATLLDLGSDLLAEKPDTCPFCQQPLDETRREHIATHRQDIQRQIGPDTGPGDPRAEVNRVLSGLRQSAHDYRELIDGRSVDLRQAASPANAERVQGLFGKGNEASWEIARSAAGVVETSAESTAVAETAIGTAIDECAAAIQSASEDLRQAEGLAQSVQRYLAATDACIRTLDELAPTLVGPAHLLRQAIDALAGTSELGLLIELFQKKASIERVLKIRDALESLKDLKKSVDQTVGEVMEAAFGTDLTGSVMNWYAKIRTTGDPDVHFSGFAMERTKGGDFKSRRVKVAAQSYGVDLASAVSSLSESKLNALGLCMSIATAVRAPGLWDFLVLDDPIQSWDEEHEMQFIEIVRSLAEQERKQIILLSHRERWVDQVAMGCRTLNGLRYRITGYTKDGPSLAAVDWASIDQRLREVISIANDASATPVRLQQAEEEIRIGACQLTSEIVKKKLGRERGAHNLNSVDVRAALNEAGCPAALVDRVVATFSTTDDAHHAPKGYEVNRERLRQYHGALTELKKWAST